MFYLLLFIYIILYTYIVRLKGNKLFDFMIFFIPIGTLLIIFLGFQDNVGTDYPSYYKIAAGSVSMGWMINKSEYLFVYLVNFIREFNKPQLLFIFTAVIQVFFLMLITYDVKKLGFKLYHFFFLFFTLSALFFNQFNLIRQYLAVFIIVYAIFKLMENKKVKFIVLVIVASLFHSSAIYTIAFLLFNSLLKKTYSFRKISLFLVTILIMSLLFNTFEFYEWLLSFTSYSYYIDSGFFKPMSIEGIITKIPKILIVIFSIYLLRKKALTLKQRYLINLAVIASTTLFLSFAGSVVWRFYHYLDFFIIFPVLMVMNDKANRKITILMSVILFIMLIIKVIIIPRGEYLYKWILF